MDVNALAKELCEYGVPLEQWGKGGAKTLDDLAIEILTGKSELVKNGAGLLRLVRTVTITIRFIDGKRVLQLKEDRQVFKGGKEVRRELQVSIVEKLKPGEDPVIAAERALYNFGIKEKIPLIVERKKVQGPTPSQLYPGIKTRSETHPFEVYLSRPLFNPDGYVEKQDDCTVYFVWSEVK